MIIKNSNVRIGDRPAAGHEKRVELLRDGDVVRALEVRCVCGEVTVVELDYSAATPAPALPTPDNPPA